MLVASKSAAAALVLLLCSCSRSHTPTVQAATAQPSSDSGARMRRELRLSGTVQAVHFFTIQVPQIYGQGGRLTLTHLIPNGSRVKAGDILAEFDSTQQMDTVRDTQAKYDDLSHQVDQRLAQNRADAAKRAVALQQAQADLSKAQIELQKGPLLGEIDRLENQVKAADAKAHVESLQKSNGFHDQSDAAALRILELQRDRQKVALERATNNVNKMQIRAPLAGMVAYENVWRNNSMGHPQEGDQLYSGQPLVRIFDPSSMAVHVMVGEPDGAVLAPGSRAVVRLDAYPDLAFSARFESANPVASSALGSPIKTFSAMFKLDQTDPRLLPDLSAAVVIDRPEAAQ
ncbi:MAG TPA: efflux RND transporter periplasmic adaptor subunit [Bryobacteraceae bacterium]|nr:efflux RND transporter periplasmic adaptor subunit [Bryobacteraceae bacterium]